MLYFAYGSNLCPNQIQSRCPSAACVHRAVLPCHKLVFTRFSQNRQCGVADVEASANDSVWGVVYELAPEDVAELDKAEGCKPVSPREQSAYERRRVTVYAEGALHRPVECETYFVVKPVPDQWKPNRDYVNLLVSGAKRWALPDEYVLLLNACECT